MYVAEAVIGNIRSIRALAWGGGFTEAQLPGWHVILGDNGAGKSTFIRAIALALVGPVEALALRQDWNDWLLRGALSELKGELSFFFLNIKVEIPPIRFDGFVRLALRHDPKYDRPSGRGRLPQDDPLQAGIVLSKPTTKGANQTFQIAALSNEANRHVWGGKSGWFCASYGPFRRFSGGDKDYERIFLSNPKLARHLSAFGESVALTESLRWLQELRFKALENQPEGKLLDAVQAFVNQADFLPHQAQLKEVSSRGVEFVDGNGASVSVEELSDGYRSILSMTFELIRQLAATYEHSQLFDKDDPTKIVVPGVVLIDEVDAHLHPTWQMRIGKWFTERFPKMQFIVTTHSPLVCQAATSVYRLPTPGTTEQGRMITGIELDRLRYGNATEAYGTEAFGIQTTRSEDSRKMTQRLAELNRKELRAALTAPERAEQERLRAALPTNAHIVSPEAMK